MGADLAIVLGVARIRVILCLSDHGLKNTLPAPGQL
jgi:hypothetical protein